MTNLNFFELSDDEKKENNGIYHCTKNEEPFVIVLDLDRTLVYSIQINEENQEIQFDDHHNHDSEEKNENNDSTNGYEYFDINLQCNKEKNDNEIYYNNFIKYRVFFRPNIFRDLPLFFNLSTYVFVFSAGENDYVHKICAEIERRLNNNENEEKNDIKASETFKQYRFAGILSRDDCVLLQHKIKDSANITNLSLDSYQFYIKTIAKMKSNYSCLENISDDRFILIDDENIHSDLGYFPTIRIWPFVPFQCASGYDLLNIYKKIKFNFKFKC